MANLTATLSLSVPGLFSQDINHTITEVSALAGLASNMARVSCDDNPQAAGAGVLIPLDTAGLISGAKPVYVYISNSGVEANGTAAETTDTVRVRNAEKDEEGINMLLAPGEFAFFPLAVGVNATAEKGGVSITKTAADVMVDYCFFTKA